MAACGAVLPAVRLDEQDVADIGRLQMTPDAEWVAIRRICRAKVCARSLPIAAID